MTPSLFTVYHKDGISVLGTDRCQKEPYQENMGDEEEFSNPHSVEAVMATCFLFDFLHLIHNLSVKQGRVFLG